MGAAASFGGWEMTDKDREEAQAAYNALFCRDGCFEKLCEVIARIRTEAKAEALREAADRAVDALKTFWTSDFESRTLDGACDCIESAILTPEIASEKED